jgi:hypothetical protein
MRNLQVHHPCLCRQAGARNPPPFAARLKNNYNEFIDRINYETHPFLNL